MKVIIRADGSYKIGLGHVFRSLALAEMLESDFSCMFAIQAPDIKLEAEIRSVCNEIIILPVTETKEEFIHELDPYIKGNEIIVLDGYAFDTEYQKNIKNKHCSLVCIDDIHAFHFFADVIINHSGSADKEIYSAEDYTQYYLGPNYSLLRRPFLRFSSKLIKKRITSNLLICMGGADPLNYTSSILSEVTRYGSFSVINVIIGSAYKYENELMNLMSGDKRITLHKNISAAEMVNIMSTCGMAICSGSSISFEYATINGLLFLKEIADNQSEVKSYFIDKGLAFDFDSDFQKVLGKDLETVSVQMIENQKKVFDKQSGIRLKKIFIELQTKYEAFNNYRN